MFSTPIGSTVSSSKPWSVKTKSGTDRKLRTGDLTKNSAIDVMIWRVKSPYTSHHLGRRHIAGSSEKHHVGRVFHKGVVAIESSRQRCDRPQDFAHTSLYEIGRFADFCCIGKYNVHDVIRSAEKCSKNL